MGAIGMVGLGGKMKGLASSTVLTSSASILREHTNEKQVLGFCPLSVVVN